MSRRLLGYEQITSSSSGVTSASDTDVTDLNVTFESDGSPVMVEAEVKLAVGTNNVVGIVKVKEGSTQLDISGMAHSTGLGLLYGPSTRLAARLTPSAGIHTYKVTIASNGSATVQVIGSSTSRNWIKVYRDD